MNSLTIAVIAIALAQALTILLTMGREREIKKLRELVTQQRIFIGEIKGWLTRERIELAQPRRMKPDHEPMADEIKAPEIKAPEPAITPRDLSDTIRPSPTEDELKRATKTFKWFKEDADEPREIVEARKIVAGLKGRAPPEPAITKVPEPAKTPKDLSDTIRPSTSEDELKRATKAINSLKEEVDKARAFVAAQQAGRIGPVMPLEIRTDQEVDADVGQSTVVPMRSIKASAVGPAASEPSDRRSGVPTETK
jgi:type II secretory pathway component PulM